MKASTSAEEFGVGSSIWEMNPNGRCMAQARGSLEKMCSTWLEHIVIGSNRTHWIVALKGTNSKRVLRVNSKDSKDLKLVSKIDISSGKLPHHWKLSQKEVFDFEWYMANREEIASSVAKLTDPRLLRAAALIAGHEIRHE